MGFIFACEVMILHTKLCNRYAVFCHTHATPYTQWGPKVCTGENASILYSYYYYLHYYYVYNNFHYKLYYQPQLTWKEIKIESLKLISDFLCICCPLLVNSKVHPEYLRKTLWSILNQIHQSVVWTHASVEVIKNENLTLCTKHSKYHTFSCIFIGPWNSVESWILTSEHLKYWTLTLL